MSQEQEKRCQYKLIVEKATEMSHYSAKRANQTKGMRVQRVYVSQAKVTAQNKGMDSKKHVQEIAEKVWNFWALGISRDMMKGKDGELEIRPRPWGRLGIFLSREPWK